MNGLYSPILFDSQELSLHFIYPRDLPATLVTPVLLLLYLPRYVGRRWRMEMQTATISASWQLQVQLQKMTMVTGLSPIGNGNADWNNSGSAAGQAPGYYGSWASASGNGEWRRMRCTCCQGRWSCTMSTTQ